MNRLVEVSYCETCKKYLSLSETSFHILLNENHNVVGVIIKEKESIK